MSLDPEAFTFKMQDRVCALLKAAEAAASQGLERMILIKTWKRAPKNWDRALIMPGVYGRIVGSTEPGKYMVDVAIADVVAELERVMKVDRK